jgi:hypothetical protein
MLSEAGGSASEFARPMREAHHGYVILFEIGTQIPQHCQGFSRLIDDEAGKALSLFHKGLKGKDVYTMLGQG